MVLGCRYILLKRYIRQALVLKPAMSSAQPAQRDTSLWQISPSKHQDAAVQYTHLRSLPLPTTLDISFDDINCKAHYQGHGKSKVAYLLKTGTFSGKVLKLCKDADQEPRLFAELSSTGIYPQIHASNSCIEYDSVGQAVGRWQAWVTDYATPLDQFLRQARLPNGAAKKMRCWSCPLHASRS